MGFDESCAGELVGPGECQVAVDPRLPSGDLPVTGPPLVGWFLFAAAALFLFSLALFTIRRKVWR
jgi:hypothetical protein